MTINSLETARRALPTVAARSDLLDRIRQRAIGSDCRYPASRDERRLLARYDRAVPGASDDLASELQDARAQLLEHCSRIGTRARSEADQAQYRSLAARHNELQARMRVLTTSVPAHSGQESPHPTRKLAALRALLDQ